MSNELQKSIDDIFNPMDIIKIKEKLEENEAPCNISGLIKEILQRIEIIEKELGLSPPSTTK